MVINNFILPLILPLGLAELTVIKRRMRVVNIFTRSSRIRFTADRLAQAVDVLSHGVNTCVNRQDFIAEFLVDWFPLDILQLFVERRVFGQRRRRRPAAFGQQVEGVV